METKIVNVHTHIFNRRNVPKDFLPPILRPVASLLENRNLAGTLSWLSSKILRQKNWANLIDRYHVFLAIGDEKSQEDILRDIIKEYPAGTRFCILPMDMKFMEAGPVEQSYTDQLEELAQIHRKPEFKDIVLPFIFVDPRRQGIFEIVKHYIETEGFGGIKMYPPLGYYPFDARLDQIYAYAEKNGIPITTHCSRGGVYYQGKITGDMLTHPMTGQHLKRTKNSDFTDVYTDPDNYEYVLKRFPKLKLNLAHFGGADEWRKYIRMDKEVSWYFKVIYLMRKYPNVYADISYTLYDPAFYPQLKLILSNAELQSRVLFGSDFYMVEQETTEADFWKNMAAFLGEAMFKQIARTNPQVFFTPPLR